MQKTSDSNFDLLFDQAAEKYNTAVKLSPDDQKAGVKIYCKESYANELYALYSNYSGGAQIGSKDFHEGQLCTVIAKSIDFENKVIITDEKYSKSTVFIPFREFTEEPSLLVSNESLHEFKVIITKASDGDYYGSERRCAAITYRDNLNDFLKTDKWFYVKVTSLVKGGYLALYKGTIKCFLPGSHAAANVIRDFNEYLNKEIPVMIENYDSANDLYIVSYKKYIKQTLPQRVHELEFGKQYAGTLTNSPYDFGIFIEFENYYTGLLHKTEVANEWSSFANMKAGDPFNFYVKDITLKKGEPRIILTDSLDKVDPERIAWQNLKSVLEGHTVNFTLDKDNFQVTLEVPGYDQTFTTDVSHLKGKIRIPNSGEVKVTRVDAIRKNVKLEFLNL